MQSYRVSQIATYLSELIATDPQLMDVWVEGEVSNLTRASSGHAYFSLKDANAQLRSVLFAGRNPGYAFEEGEQVLCQGSFEFYIARGEITFIVAFVQPAGVGPLQAEFERLKTRLEEEGLFDPARKRALPAFPRKIAVVTSSDAAVWQDIQRVLGRRWPLVEVLFVATPVQGPGAVPGIVDAMERLQSEAGVDVVIVARGGGSIEDLWAFNEEPVARAIFRSAVPVVTGIGHEQDVTIADLVADKRGSTPSVAAELVVPDQADIRARLAAFERAALSSLERALMSRAEDLERRTLRLNRGLPQTTQVREKADRLLRSAGACIDRQLASSRASGAGLGSRLFALSPQATLERGYAIVQKDGHALRRPSEVKTGQALAIRLAEGDLHAIAGKGSPRRTRRVNVSELQAAMTLDGAS